MIHVISDASLKRPGYIYERDGTAEGFVGYPAFQQPEINWKHIDGPLLYCSDNSLHWLTYRERIQMALGWVDIHDLDAKHCRRPRQ